MTHAREVASGDLVTKHITRFRGSLIAAAVLLAFHFPENSLSYAQNQAFPDSTLRLRVFTGRSVLVVYDVLVPPDNPRDHAGYLAYWGLYGQESMLVYDRLLYTPRYIASFTRAPGGRITLVVIGEKNAPRLGCALGERTGGNR